MGIIFVLLVSELDAFFYGVNETEPFIAVSDDHERIRVNLNISLKEIPCQAISLDYQDITGTHFEDIKQTIHKLRLHSDGSFINKHEVEAVKRI